MSIKHKISSLPKWAQSLIAAQNTDIKVLKRRIENLENSHDLLYNYEWFAINAPSDLKPGEAIHLWLLDKDNPHALCSLSYLDKLLIVRKKHIVQPVSKILQSNKIKQPKNTKAIKKNNQKYGRLPKRYYGDICFVFSYDIDKFHGKKWKNKFAKVFGINNTCPVIPSNHPDNDTGKDISGIYYNDYLRFADLVDYDKPTYFD